MIPPLSNTSYAAGRGSDRSLLGSAPDMKYPKTLDEWRYQFDRLTALPKPLKPSQAALLERATIMVEHDGNPPVPETYWTPEQTNTLCDIIADGGSFGAVGRAIGKRTPAVQSRWAKVVRSLGWQAA